MWAGLPSELGGQLSAIPIELIGLSCEKMVVYCDIVLVVFAEVSKKL